MNTAAETNMRIATSAVPDLGDKLAYCASETHGFIKKIPPFFRGIIHLTTYLTVLAMIVIMFIVHATKRRPLYWPAVIYLFSQLVLFGVSAFYHRYNFSDGIIYKQRVYRNVLRLEKYNGGLKYVLQKMDHACIYILIAGSQTSTLLSLYYSKKSIPNPVIKFMYVTWAYALMGILKVVLCDYVSFLDMNNDMTNTFIYIVHGFLVLPIIKYFYKEMNLLGLVCLFLGAFFYSIGGILFALEVPHMTNKKFGFHEFWHLQTVFANACFGLPIFLKYREWWRMGR
ncbi:UPF0073 membrane protein [Cucumispora dikerogammari]|nr:UPF0073 membrane protein [Cucumispora dikerogammari]